MIGRAMGTITFKFDGIEISASCAADAAELIRELNKGKTAIPAPVVSKAAANGHRVIAESNDAELAAIDADNAKMALDFLSTIRDGANVPATALMKLFGLTAPKGLGSKSASVNKVIKAAGLKPSMVYKNPKTHDGRFWRPGRRMGEAIQLLEKRLAQH
jgi:hypothetical protein